MEGTWRGEVKQVRKGGHEFDANLTGTPVRDRSGEVIGIISVAQDVTQTKLAQKLYTTLTVKGKELEMLQKVDHLRKDLIATVSHELRNPLASIKGYISTLLQPDVTWEPELQQEFLKIADREAERLNRLVGDLLTLSQLESGLLPMERTPADLALILRDMEHHLGPLASGHTLEVRVPSDLPQVLVDQHRLSQVISNLVSNASKFSESGTRIVVEAEQQARRVVVRVRDRGRGIPADQLDLVFEPFYRVDCYSETSRPGSGLGLSICKRVIQAHGGEMWVESEAGEGSTFFFSVPIAD